MRAASLTAEIAVKRRPSRPFSRPSASPSKAVSRVPAAISRAPESAFECFFTLRAARRTIATVKEPDTAPVTRSTSSWASSIMTVLCSGRTFMPSKALIASRAWFVMTMSASAARLRAISLKHSSTSGQRRPKHSAALTDTCAQARSETPGFSSSRSPVSVRSAHSRRRTTSSPTREVEEGMSKRASGSSSG